MVRKIVRDVLFLSIPSGEADQEDTQTVRDLEDTLRFHAQECVGMASNMIGVNRRVIAVNAGGLILTLINPVIVRKSDPYEAEEGCLCLPGTRKTTRYGEIDVEYRDRKFGRRRSTFRGETAQIIQHEIDHLEGKLI